MKILVIGRNGQLSRHLHQIFGKSAYFVSRADFDLANVGGVYAALSQLRERFAYDVIINAGAYTDTHKSESEAGLAFAVNAAAVAELARFCRQHQILLVHVSTDYVFDGKKSTAYVETDKVAPLGVYGESKALGEALIAHIAPAYLIVRTSWVFSAYRQNFVKSIIGLLQTRASLDVVSDQIGCPTYAGHLAKVISELLLKYEKKQREGQTPPSGIYHYADTAVCSWFDFASVIRDKLLAIHPEKTLASLNPISSSAWKSSFARPANSELNCEKLQKDYGIARFQWQQSLPQVIQQVLQSPDA